MKTETTWHPITTKIYIKTWRNLKNIGFPLCFKPLAIHPSKSFLCFEHIARLWFPTSFSLGMITGLRFLYEGESSRNGIRHQAWPIKTPYVWFSILFSSSWLVNWSPGKVANHPISQEFSSFSNEILPSGENFSPRQTEMVCQLTSMWP